MRVRHRTPSIFSISMVDVLCCALGCMILMWLVSAQRASDGDESGKRIQLDLKSARDREEELKKLLASVTVERDRKSKTLTELQAQATSLEEKKRRLDKLLEAQEKRLKEVEALLGSVRAENVTLSKAAQKDKKDLQEDKKDLQKSVEELTRRARELAGKLAAAEKLADQLPTVKGELKDVLGKLDAQTLVARATKAELARLKKEQAELTKTVKDLEQQKKKLLDDIARVPSPADNRFSGIQLTGKRVIFLVDTSGSMDSIDEKTPAPTKWAEVRNSVVKVMRSLPQLEKFQLVSFGEEITFPLGSAGEWFDYDARTSLDRVEAALARIKPKGGTNMYKPMEAAFRYRARGLDTLYLFSDGLPNEGEGLTPQQDRTIKDESQRSTLLARFIRSKLENDWNRSIRGKNRVRINAIGFFYESPDVGAFLWAMARENEGSFVGMSKP